MQLSSLISSFLGETASQLQNVFDLAASRPLVLFLDEFDAVAKERDDPQDIGELKRVLNSLLQAIDKFNAPESLLIAATNHDNLIDRALWRRFDDCVEFGLPSNQERLIQLKRLLSGVHIDGSLATVTRTAANMSFADIERAAVDAIKTMILTNKKAVKTEDILERIAALRSNSKRRSGTSKARK